MSYKVLLVLSLFILSSCKMRFNENTSKVQSEDFPTRTDVEEFRNTFASIVGTRYGNPELQQLLYYPVAEMYRAKAGADGAAFFKELDAIYRGLTPDQLFTAAAGSHHAPGTPDWKDLLKKTPITFILVPGVMGEFIKTRPMEEVLERVDSTASKMFVAAFNGHPDQENKNDAHYSLEQFKDVSKPLTDLMVTGSLDDTDGNALVQVIGFNMPLMSLESLGRNENIAQLYLRRLAKYFAIAGLPQNIVFLGYSRGSGVALDMMSRAKEQGWFKNVRGFVALGGVIYGSDLADQAEIEGSKLNRQLKALDELIATLRAPDEEPILARPGVFSANNKAWMKFLATMAAIDPHFVKVTLENAKGSDLGATFVLVRHLWGALNLDKFLTDYSDNIRRFRHLTGELKSAVVELTTSNRLNWWRQNTVPTNGVAYYSVTATMADPETAKMGAANATNTVSYNPESADYRTLIGGYRDFAKTTGFSVNDSQVALHKAMFWPEIHASLNPAQQPLKTRYLGILGTHHWALALRVVSEMKDGSLNPYPREDLLRAIASKISWDLSRE